MRDPPISTGKLDGTPGFVRKFGKWGPHFPRVPRTLFDIDPLRATEMLNEKGFLKASIRKEMRSNPNYLDYWGTWREGW